MKLWDFLIDKKGREEKKTRKESFRRYLAKCSDRQLIMYALYELNEASLLTRQEIADELYKRLPDKL